MIDSNPDARAISSNAEILQVLIDSVPDHAMILLDADGCITLWNAGAERLLGWTQAEALGRDETLYFAGTDDARMQVQQDRARAAQQERAEQERWHARRDGTLFWANSLLLSLRDHSLRGYVRIVRDLSQSQAQAQRAQAAQTRLLAALEEADIGTWFFDIVQDRVEADLNMARFFSVSPDEANGGPLESYLRPIYPDDLPRVREAIGDSVTNGTRYDIEFRLVRPSGEYFWIAARGNANRDAQGQPVSMSGVVIDITAKRAAEAASLEARAQAQRERLLLDAVLDAMPAGVIIAEPNGRLVRFNRALKQIWGGTLDALDVAGYKEYVGYWYDTGQRIEAHEWAMARALHGEHCAGDLVEIETMDGRGRRVILNCAAPVYDAEGRIVAGVVAEVDVTDQVRAEEALRINQTHIETLNARLLRSMRETHHRVKNNLQVIAALVEIQDEQALSPALQRIKNHARALASIHDMLTYQVKDGDELTHISVASVMARLLPSLEQVSGGRRIQSDIEDFAIDIQKAASLALLVNECVSNAIKHSRGNVSIRLTRHDARATLAIGDDGDGFPPDFDPRKAANTGLELIDSAARWDLRGDVRYENAPNGGGCVICTFPIS